MQPEPETITLGGKSWTIRPFTLRQLREIEPFSKAQASGEIGSLEYMENVLAVALRRDHPDEIVGLPDLEMTIGDIREAQASIMRLSGIAKELEPGEAPAAPPTVLV